jgi:WD40 repeat protein
LPSKTERKIAAHTGAATCLCYNASGNIIVSGGADSLVKVWNPMNGMEVATLRGMNKPITDVTISVDNLFLAGSSSEHKAIVWSLKTMRTLHEFYGHTDTINACKFSFAIQSLITGSSDSTIKFWDL